MPATSTARETLPPVIYRNGVAGYVFGQRFIPRMAGAEDDPKADPDPKTADPKKDDEDFDKDRALATIRTLREKEKQGKATARELEAAQAKLRELEDRDKSEVERATAKATETEQKLTAAQTKLRDMAIRVAVAETASAAGVAPENVKAAIRLLDASALEFDDDGEPKNVEAALKALVKEYPMLAPATGGDGKTATKSTPATPKPAGTPNREDLVKKTEQELAGSGRYRL